MFNLSGSEIIVILLLALVVLGPDKLPDAMRRAGKTFAELKKLSSGFQDEVRKGFEEPAKEVKKTAAAVKSAAKFTVDTTATDTTATESSAPTDGKPRYNPATDPPPELPEGSSVAEPLTEPAAEPAPSAEAETEPAPVAEPAPSAEAETEPAPVAEAAAEAEPVADPDGEPVDADPSPAAPEPSAAVEADRTA